ncbi:MAG: NAD-dependent deacylase [Ignavibacteriaceae bacterium]
MIDQKTIETFKTASSVVFFTGAGISAESGIPTFRGVDGIWNKMKPEELASFKGFMKNPELVWEWYKYRKKIVHESMPNPGHIAIAEMQEIIPEVIVVTQNVDNLHRRAGSKIIYELHGNIERNFCIDCKKRYDNEIDLTAKIPTCTCGGMIRPDVVWFGEFLPEDQFTAAEKAAQNCGVFVVAGTSAVVFPAAGLIYTAKQSGAYIIEVNLEETEISRYADVSFFNKTGVVLPNIVKCLNQDL